MAFASAVLTAAGSGSRLGADVPKALVHLDGKPLVAHALQGLADSGVVDAICVTCPPTHVSLFRDAVADAKVDTQVVVVPGGISRQQSVFLGLRGLSKLLPDLDSKKVVLVHDAARCLASAQFIARVALSVSDDAPAVIPGLPVTDTIKVVRSTAGLEPIVSTPNRADLRSIQTPQAFQWGLLMNAHYEGLSLGESELTAASDDAGLVELMGGYVVVCPGEERSFKITTTSDLVRAQKLLGALDC